MIQSVMLMTRHPLEHNRVPTTSQSRVVDDTTCFIKWTRLFSQFIPSVQIGISEKVAYFLLLYTYLIYLYRLACCVLGRGVDAGSYFCATSSTGTTWIRGGARTLAKLRIKFTALTIISPLSHFLFPNHTHIPIYPMMRVANTIESSSETLVALRGAGY